MMLPIPSHDALMHQQKLLRFLDKILKSKGQISFAEFMAMALYAPGLGYYSAGAQKFGKEGDFITAPLISPLFSQCIANQCAPILAKLKHGCILELGAGTGRMACDIIQTLTALKQLPQTYAILEVSADLRQRQQRLLKKECKDYFEHVVWLDKLPDEPIEGIILGNEVLDAMPVEIFKIGENAQILQAYVSNDNDWQINFKEANKPLTQAVKDLQSNLENTFEEGYTSEINLGLTPWIRSLSDILSQGVMFFIDYGFSRHEYYHPSRHMGTLMCHYRHHAHSDPLRFIGLQDITAHVDFTALAHAGVLANCEVSGFTTQGAFLLSLGLLENMHLDAKEQLKISQQIQRLSAPHEMGELFKVMALSKNIEDTLQGFSMRDFRHRL
ncbi:MAG: class I SAM-dependent methyltransferase [Candidatus Berkiella sp.]